jgi:hypothetical protein
MEGPLTRHTIDWETFRYTLHLQLDLTISMLSNQDIVKSVLQIRTFLIISLGILVTFLVKTSMDYIENTYCTVFCTLYQYFLKIYSFTTVFLFPEKCFPNRKSSLAACLSVCLSVYLYVHSRQLRVRFPSSIITLIKLYHFPSAIGEHSLLKL